MNKRKIKLLGYILATVIICLVFFQLNKLENAIGDLKPIAEEVAPASGSDEVGLSRSEEIKNHFDSINKPIDFWGRVVDQDGEGIEGAIVVFHVHRGDAVLMTGVVDVIEIASGLDGRFSINNKEGHILSLKNITKEGYRFTAKQKMNFNLSRRDFVPSYSEINPIQYVIIRDELVTPLSFYSYRLSPKWDGGAVDLNLRFGENSQNSDISIVLNRGEMVDRRCDWDVSVKCIGSGIVEVREDDGTIAPINGYLDSWEIGFNRLDEHYRSGYDGTFFIKTKDGLYSRVRLNLYADWLREESTSLVMRVFINETGGRILEDNTANSQY